MLYKEGLIRGIRFGKICNRYLIDLSVSIETKPAIKSWINEFWNGSIFDFGFCFAVDDPFLIRLKLIGITFWFRLLGVSYEDVLLKNGEE